MEIRVAEMFAGIGGFRLGLERCNSNAEGQRGKDIEDERELPNGGKPDSGFFKCVWANEWDYDPDKRERQWAWKVYKNHWDDGTLRVQDIRSITAGSIPDHDLLVAGFPCQPFSMSGRRRGTSDSRGTLFNEILRVLEAKRPAKVLLENVDGLLSIEGGETFAQMLYAMGDMGYFVEWQVLDSQYFGVPQHRERVFIVGHLGGEPRRKVFPFIGEREEGQGEVRAGLKQVGLIGEDTEATRVYATSGIARTIKNGGGLGAKTGLYEVSGTLTEALGTRQGSSKEFIRSVLTVYNATSQIRRLTPVECERLQGFPDNWTKVGISESQRYKCIGNAVTVPVIECLGKRIAESGW